MAWTFTFWFPPSNCNLTHVQGSSQRMPCPGPYFSIYRQTWRIYQLWRRVWTDAQILSPLFYTQIIWLVTIIITALVMWPQPRQNNGEKHIKVGRVWSGWWDQDFHPWSLDSVVYGEVTTGMGNEEKIISEGRGRTESAQGQEEGGQEGISPRKGPNRPFLQPCPRSLLGLCRVNSWMDRLLALRIQSPLDSATCWEGSPQHKILLCCC